MKYIVVIFTLVLLFIIINVYGILYNKTEYSVDSIYDLSETGDLVLFRWKLVSLDQEFVSPYTHVGIIVVKNGEKFILESHSKGDTKNIGVTSGGVHLYPLKLRVKNYEGHIFFSKLNSSIKIDEIDKKQFINSIPDLQKIKFRHNYKEFYAQQCIAMKLCTNCIKSNQTDELMCSEFIALCLKKLNILDDDYNHICTVPYDFLTIKINNEYVYNKVLKIKK